MTLLVTDTYTDIATADTYLILKDDWLQLSNEKKDEALLEARYFIDENFYTGIEDVSDLALIPDELQLSNSLLAYDFIANGSLFARHTAKSVKESSVKAGSVQSSKKFIAGNPQLLPSSYSKVKVLLADLYESIDGIVHLVRA